MWYIINCSLVELCLVRNTVIGYSDGLKVLKVKKNDAVNTPNLLQQKYNLQLLLHFCHQKAACRQMKCMVKPLRSSCTPAQPQTKTFWLQSWSLHHCGKRRSPFPKPWWCAVWQTNLLCCGEQWDQRDTVGVHGTALEQGLGFWTTPICFK